MHKCHSPSDPSTEISKVQPQTRPEKQQNQLPPNRNPTEMIYREEGHTDIANITRNRKWGIMVPVTGTLTSYHLTRYYCQENGLKNTSEPSLTQS